MGPRQASVPRPQLLLLLRPRPQLLLLLLWPRVRCLVPLRHRRPRKSLPRRRTPRSCPPRRRSRRVAAELGPAAHEKDYEGLRLGWAEPASQNPPLDAPHLVRHLLRQQQQRQRGSSGSSSIELIYAFSLVCLQLNHPWGWLLALLV